MESLEPLAALPVPKDDLAAHRSRGQVPVALRKIEICYLFHVPVQTRLQIQRGLVPHLHYPTVLVEERTLPVIGGRDYVVSGIVILDRIDRGVLLLGDQSMPEHGFHALKLRDLVQPEPLDCGM